MKSDYIMKINNRLYLKKQIKDRYENTGLGDPEGLQKINSGHNRIVYQVIDKTYGVKAKDMIIKIQYPNSTENEEEIKVWEKYKNTKFSKYLVPIIDYSNDYNWILMPYGESVPNELVDNELYNLLVDKGGSDISKDDFIYNEGNYTNQKCCDYASLK